MRIEKEDGKRNGKGGEKGGREKLKSLKTYFPQINFLLLRLPILQM